MKEPQDTEIELKSANLACHDCARIFTNPRVYDNHMKRCTLNKRYIYPNKEYHVLVKRETTPGSKYHCKECHRKYGSLSDLHTHLRMECGKNSICRFYCDHCMQSYLNKEGLIMHLRKNCRSYERSIRTNFLKQ